MFFYNDPFSQRGACADLPEEQKQWFFSTRGNQYRWAVKICQTCPIKDECLQEALKNETPGMRRFGVFGGMAAETRRQMFG